MMNRILSVAVSLSTFTLFATGLPSWKGVELSRWMRGAHQIASVRQVGDCIEGVVSGGDPFLTVVVTPFSPTVTQEIVFRGKSPAGGIGEFYWSSVGSKGPTPKTCATFEWIGDGQWHEYRVRPHWQGAAPIRTLRIDFPPSSCGKGVALADIRVVDEWNVVRESVAGRSGVTFTCSSSERCGACFEWETDLTPGVVKTPFTVPGDGRSHRFYLPLSGDPAWKGSLVSKRIVRRRDGSELPVSDMRLCEEEPDMPADLVTIGVNCVTPVCRVGTEGRIEAVVRNLGVETAHQVALRAVTVPPGVSVRTEGPRNVVGRQDELLAMAFSSTSPLNGTVRVAVVEDGRVVSECDVAVKVGPSLGLPKADYVPEPRPPACDYEIGALYYPGWERAEAWKRVWRTCPERRPVLGWYDETRPEVVDWQIKWLSENGIRALYVDWYWHKGHRHHEHWIKAFQQARWRAYLKWAVMWANHTPEGAHSEADQREVTRYWIENYFNTPEYLTYDGKPVVWIWQAQNMNRDLGTGGARKLLDLSRQMAVEAGFKGIHFIVMKWPEDVCTPQLMNSYKAMGCDEVGIYHFMGHGGKAPSPRRYAYSLVADANADNWRRQHEVGILPFLPNLSTGWDDRPWNDRTEIYGKNAADFRRICREAKRFADETGQKRLCLAPVNEWGEGSYAEPNAELGFSFYEAVRETFCREPKEGWPQNMTPADIGLGPYDLPPPAQPKEVFAWDFTDGRPSKWQVFMGGAGVKRTADGLSFRTTTRDPALHVPTTPFDSRKIRTLTVRMRLTDARGSVSVFWARDLRGMREGARLSLPVRSDGQFHDYVFPVGSHPAWKGRIGGLRLDPCDNAGAQVTVATVHLD